MTKLEQGLSVTVAIFTVVAGAFAVLQYFKSDKPTAQADKGSVAVGGNVGGDVKLNTYDADEPMRQKAQAYVSAAGGTCKEMVASIQGMTPDANRNMMEILFTVPPSLQMTEDAIAYYGNGAANEVERRIDALAKANVQFQKIYMRRNIQAMTASALSRGGASEKSIEHLKEMGKREDAEARGTFDAQKASLLESAAGLCTYIQKMQPAPKRA